MGAVKLNKQRESWIVTMNRDLNSNRLLETKATRERSGDIIKV